MDRTRGRFDAAEARGDAASRTSGEAAPGAGDRALGVSAIVPGRGKRYWQNSCYFCGIKERRSAANAPPVGLAGRRRRRENMAGSERDGAGASDH